jgi:mRNA interferase YafO
MKINITQVLKQHLEIEGWSVDELCSLFREWKLSDEYGSYYFGKDSFYVKPSVNGELYKLRHVHLVPIKDEEQLLAWNKAWELGRRKTSNRVLIYVDDKKGNFLLIFILSEPDAHEIALMKNEKHKKLMESFAIIAEEFIFDGSIEA